MHDRIHHRWDYFLNEVYESLRKSVDSETLCHIVRLISRQQDEMKIYTMPFMRLTFSTRRFQMYKANLIDASIGELRRRLGELDEVTIRAQGRNINALSPLLQARSTYFKRLISDNSKKTSFEIEGLYKTIQFVVLYAHCKLDHVEREFGFEPCDSRDTTEKTLNELINILHAASTFEIADLFGAVEQHIMRYGHSFIYPKNAQEIKIIAKEVNAGILERYCDAFIATNLRTFTLFLSLPAELRLIIWRQVASQPRLVEVTWPGNRRQTPPHIARTLKVCRESHAEMQQFWGGPRIGGVNFQFDIIWFDTDDLPNDVFPRILKEAHYCAIVAPPYPHLNSNFWELEVSKVINCCPCLKVLYLATETLSDNDEIEYCRRFTNREPTTLVEARNWIEESAHQRLWENIPKGCGLPKIILVDETEMKRLSDIAI
ncbi:hypothetical protein V500_04081 [Pseudogymnoascus sp. VKM F-4518 (FW-2643)]|nr:hypothetical protein V500_04081 [Pseudogymnoascus sp. VKM F-4518 (FW-2643)]